MHRQAALAVAALLALPAAAQSLLGESGCLYLSGSTMCPGFSSSYVAVYDMTSVGQFFNSVYDVASWDLAFQNYLNSSTNGSGFRRSKFESDLSCSDAVDTDATIRWQQTFLCAQFVNDQSSIDCKMTYLGVATQQNICSSTCDEFSESEQAITSNRSLCSGRSTSQITQDLNTCNTFASSGSSCVSGEQNERNCGYGNWTEQLCSFCSDSSEACCSSADLSICDFAGSSTSGGRSGSTSSTGGATGAAGNSGSSKSGISGGAIAGIVIGVIGGLLVLGALLFFFCRRRRNNRSPSGQDGHVLMKSTDEFPATPQLSESAHSGMDAEKTHDPSIMQAAAPAAAGVGAGALAGAGAAGLAGAHANRNANATTRNAGNPDFSVPQTDFSANSQASTLTPTNRTDPGMGSNGYSVSPGPSPAPTGSTGSGHLGSNNHHRGAEAAAAVGAGAVGAAALHHHHNNKKLPNEPGVTSGTGGANFAPGSRQGHSPTRAAHVPGTGSGAGVPGPNFAASPTSPTSPGPPTYSSHGHDSAPTAPGPNFAAKAPGSNFAANAPHSGSAPIHANHATGPSPSHSSHHGAMAAGAAGVAGAAALGAAAARSGRSGHSDGRNRHPSGPTTPPATSTPGQYPTQQAHAAGTASPVAVTAPSSPMIDAEPAPSSAPKALPTPPQAPSAAPVAAPAAAPAAAAATSTTPASALLPGIQDASGAWIRPGSTVSVVHPYPASLSDELSLQPGMRILVHELFNDGWANGTVSATAADGSPQGRRGQFPAVCVAAG